MRKILAVALLVLAACSSSSSDPAAGTGPKSPEASSPASSPVDNRRLDAYEALVRSEVAGEPGNPWETVYVLIPICDNADAPVLPKGCDDSFTPDEQAQLTARLSDLGSPVEFIPEIGQELGHRVLVGKERSIILHLGPISPQDDGSLRIPASYNCGGLCGSGTTFILSVKDGNWAVTGSTGGAWIACGRSLGLSATKLK